MALTTTTLSGAITSGATQVTLAAFTAPTGLSFLSRAWMIIDSELFLITDTSLSPTLGVTRGHGGTQANAHSNLAGVKYGVPGDFTTYNGVTTPGPGFFYRSQKFEEQTMTGTGVTGSTAAVVTIYPPGFLNVDSGASGSGLNLPVPNLGDQFFIKNGATGDLKIYSVGANVNGVTGTTGATVTVTGNKGALAYADASGSWQIFLNT